MKNKIWYSDLSSDLSTPTAPNLVTEIVFDKVWYAAGSNLTPKFISYNAVYILGWALSCIMQIIFMVIYCHVHMRLYVFIAEICMKNKIWYSDHYSDLSTPTAPKKFTNLVTEIVFDKVWCIVGSKQ